MAGAELTDPRAASVKSARRLARRVSRQDARRFLAEGVPAVREALAAAVAGDVVVRELFLTPSMAQRQEGIAALAAQASVPVHTGTDEVLAALSETVTPQGIVAVCDFLDRPLNGVLTPATRLVALLAEIRDPGNAGSVLRAADAAGADAAIFTAGSVDPYNGKVVRASVGSLFHVPVVTDAPPAATVDRLRAAGLQVLAADAAGDLDLDEAAQAGLLVRPTAWLFGNEAWGLPDPVRALADHVVRIPIYGRAESLNLATAATLCLYASARAHRG